MSAPPRERRWWTSSEDEVLQNRAQIQMDRYGSVKNWNEIAALLPYRTNKDCRKRWYKVRRDIRKGAWMPEEDKKLEEAVAQVGLKWSTVARIMQTRNADQCAKRWQHVLGPDFKHAPWTPEEDRILQEAIAKYGNNWKQLGLSELPDRSTHDIRNRSVTLSRRNGRIAGNTATQKPLQQPPSPSPSTPSSETDSSSRLSSSSSRSSISLHSTTLDPNDIKHTNPSLSAPSPPHHHHHNPCWSTTPTSALLDSAMTDVVDSPFFTSCWGVSPNDMLAAAAHHNPHHSNHHSSLRSDFDPWLHQLTSAAAAGIPLSHHQTSSSSSSSSLSQQTGLQTPETEPFLLGTPGPHDSDPLDALCFLDDAAMPVDDGDVVAQADTTITNNNNNNNNNNTSSTTMTTTTQGLDVGGGGGSGEMIFKTEICGSGGSSPELKVLRSPVYDGGMGSSPEGLGDIVGGLGELGGMTNASSIGTVATTSSSSSSVTGRKGSVTILLRQSDSHLTSDVVRGLMGLDVDLTIRVVRD